MAIREQPCPHEYAPVVLRQMRQGDLAACHRIDRLCAHPDVWDETRWWDETNGSPVLVAIQGQTVAGCCLYRFHHRLVVIERLIVHPHVWRCGVGTLLAQRVVDVARMHNRPVVRVTVPLSMKYAAGLAFFKYLRWPGYMTDAGDGVSFVKELRNVEVES